MLDIYFYITYNLSREMIFIFPSLFDGCSPAHKTTDSANHQ